MCISKQEGATPAVFPAEELIGKAQTSRQQHHPHIVVRHDYHDHSNEVAPAFDNFESLARSGANTAFPLKLYDMLQRVDEEGHSDIVSWQPHGRCFVVHKPDEFKELLPRYFKLSKIASFQRQLNLYGFQRLTRGSDRGGYYHELFLRGMPFLIQRMTRVKVKGTGVRARSNPEQEPNFWNMPFMGEKDISAAPSTEVISSSQKVASHSSIVSAEDNSEHDSEDMDESSEMDPLPVRLPSHEMGYQQVLESSADLRSQTLFHPNETQYENDVVLTGWGMPFHYLESVDFPEANKLPSSVDVNLSSPKGSIPSVVNDRNCSVNADPELESFLMTLLDSSECSSIRTQTV